MEDADDQGPPDPTTLTDDDLKNALLRHGVKVGPIVGKIPPAFLVLSLLFLVALQKCVFDLASTRAVYEKKLRRLLQSSGCDEKVNEEEENSVLYSDSEDEEDGENKFCYFFLDTC